MALMALSQIDVSKPDHVSVITKDNKVTVSVTKDGQSVTLGFQILKAVDQAKQVDQQLHIDNLPQLWTDLATPPKQPTPQPKVVKTDPPNISLRKRMARSKHYVNGNAKLGAKDVREIKLLLADDAFVKEYPTRVECYKELGKIYGVTSNSISSIDRGISWTNIKI